MGARHLHYDFPFQKSVKCNQLSQGHDFQHAGVFQCMGYLSPCPSQHKGETHSNY